MKEKDRVVHLAYCACGAAFEISRLYYKGNPTNAWLKKLCPVCGRDDRI